MLLGGGFFVVLIGLLSNPFKSTGQNNVYRSCSVVWSDVGFVCPARSFGVDKVCLFQYLDGLFAYFLPGRSEMLVSGHSIFQFSS